MAYGGVWATIFICHLIFGGHLLNIPNYFPKKFKTASKDIKTKNEELRIECSLQIHLLNSSFFFIYFRLLQLFNPNITELDRRAMS